MPIPLNAAGPSNTEIDRGERDVVLKSPPAESKRDVLYVPEFARVTRRILFIHTYSLNFSVARGM